MAVILILLQIGLLLLTFINMAIKEAVNNITLGQQETDQSEGFNSFAMAPSAGQPSGYRGYGVH